MSAHGIDVERETRVLILLVCALFAPAVHTLNAPLTLRRPAVELRPVAKPRCAPPVAAASLGKRISTISSGFGFLDKFVVDPVVRIGNHAPAFASLSYFGLISMTQMMATQPSMMATFRAVITRAVGPTSNAMFSAMFSTLVTPANFVFLIWPVIGALQLLTVLFSALRPGAPLKQSELTALSLANVCATLWLIVSSNALKGVLPLWSVLTLPLVPIVAGFPLRSACPPKGFDALVFQVFSSFTTIASFLALAVELQYGGRVALFLGRAEPAALVFAALTAFVVSLRQRCTAKRLVNLLAVGGIVWNRVAVGTASATSPSFVALVACLGWAVKQLLGDGAPRQPGADGYVTF